LSVELAELFEPLARSFHFGNSLANLGDLDGDGTTELAVGAPSEDEIRGKHGVLLGGRGALWIISLDAQGTVQRLHAIKQGAGGFSGDLEDDEQFGYSVANLGDVDSDGVADVAVGSPFFGEGFFTPPGAVWVVFLAANGTAKGQVRIDPEFGALAGAPGPNFGWRVAGLGDLDADGVGDLAVSAGGNGGDVGDAIWVLFLHADGSVKAHQKISSTEGGLAGPLEELDGFGGALASLGDLDGDGIGDLAVGAGGDNDGGNSRGAVWILFLAPDGTVRSERKISDTAGGFSGRLEDFDGFGVGLACLGDLDQDGVQDLAAGALGDNGITGDVGAVWILLLNRDGTVKAERKISQTEGNFRGTLQDFGFFALALAPLGDLDQDGIVDLAVGAPNDFFELTGDHSGSVWLFFLRGPSPSGAQLPSDCSQDGRLDISDAVCLLGNLFLGSPRTLPCDQGTASETANRILLDCNGDGRLDISDAVCVLGWLFAGGPPPSRGTSCIAIEACPQVCSP
jgi:hypothetical protein